MSPAWSRSPSAPRSWARPPRRTPSPSSSSARRATSGHPVPTSTTAPAWSTPWLRSSRPPRPPSSALGGPDDEDAAGRVMRDLVRHRAEQEALGAGHALVADDDQVGALLLGDVEDGVGGVALARVGLDLHAGLLGLLGRLAERRVDVLARVDHPLDVVGDLRALLPQALAGDGLVGADELELGLQLRREVHRLLDRLIGGLRPVCTDHDRLEHAALPFSLSWVRDHMPARSTSTVTPPPPSTTGRSRWRPRSSWPARRSRRASNGWRRRRTSAGTCRPPRRGWPTASR